MRRVLLFGLFVSVAMLSWGQQNLVLNPSLEDFGNDTFPTYWKGANLTPDIYREPQSKSVGTGKLLLGIGIPTKNIFTPTQFGKTCFGLMFGYYMNPLRGTDVFNYTEVMQGTLASPLKAGTEYLIKMNVICPKIYIGKPLREISVYLSASPLNPLTDKATNPKGLENYSIPYVSLTAEKGANLDKVNTWMEVSAKYVAAGGEKYISIGNFNDANKANLSTQSDKITIDLGDYSKRSEAMFIYDNVSVTEVAKNAPAPTVTPTPAPEPVAAVKDSNVYHFPPLNRLHLYFDPGQANLWERSFQILDSLAREMTKNPEWIIILAGHTDSDGADKSNEALSAKRAQAAKAFLESMDVASHRIVYRYYGEKHPLNDNSDFDKKLLNRRVEILVVKNPDELSKIAPDIKLPKPAPKPKAPTATKPVAPKTTAATPEKTEKATPASEEVKTTTPESGSPAAKRPIKPAKGQKLTGFESMFNK